MTTVLEISEELGLPISWVIKILMGHGAIVSGSRVLTDDEVDLIYAAAERLARTH